MQKCKCNSGRMTLTVHADGTTNSVEIDCVNCGGSGYLTELQAARIKAMDEIWCRCGNPSERSIYHPDVPGSKHHWTCADCGKVTQVG